MAKALRKDAKDGAYWETMRDRLNAGKAVTVLNTILAGGEKAAAITPQQERVAVFLVNKLMPNLQAIAMRVEEQRPTSRRDINALLASTGIRPEQAWAAINGTAALEGEHTREKVEPDQSLADPPTPADRA